MPINPFCESWTSLASPDPKHPSSQPTHLPSKRGLDHRHFGQVRFEKVTCLLTSWRVSIGFHFEVLSELPWLKITSAAPSRTHSGLGHPPCSVSRSAGIDQINSLTLQSSRNRCSILSSTGLPVSKCRTRSSTRQWCRKAMSLTEILHHRPLPAKYTESKQRWTHHPILIANELSTPAMKVQDSPGLCYEHPQVTGKLLCTALPLWPIRSRRMLQRNLIYMAITRSKSKLILLGEYTAFDFKWQGILELLCKPIWLSADETSR